jgi:uncharacterized membrane protein
MLCDAKESEAFPDRQKIYEWTRAIFFFGTPHQGSNFAAWAEIARGFAKVIFDTNSKSVKQLKVHSESLVQLQKHFDALIYKRTFWIYTFTEAQGYRPVPLLNSKVELDPLRAGTREK